MFREERASAERKGDSAPSPWFYMEEQAGGVVVCQSSEKGFTLPPACCATHGKSLSVSEPFALQEGGSNPGPPPASWANDSLRGVR